MVKAAIVLYSLGMISIVLGAHGIGGLTVPAGKSLLFLFLVLAVISFIASLVKGDGHK